MSAVAKQQSNIIQMPNDGFDKSKKELIKNTLCKGCTDDELELFIYACKRTGLDPFAKQIYAIKRGYNMTIQTSIDGYRLIADRTGMYSPGKESTFTYDKDGNITSATAYVRKMTPDGTWHEVSATAHFSEYKPKGEKMDAMWRSMPHVMIAKCAEALALRKAFPAHMSGVYTDDEMAQAKSPDTLSNEEQIEVMQIFEEFPAIKDRFINYLTKDGGKFNIAEVSSKYFELIQKAAKIEKEKNSKLVNAEVINE